MTPEHAPSSDATIRLDPAAMTVEDAAKLLTKAGGVRIAMRVAGGKKGGSKHLLILDRFPGVNTIERTLGYF